VGPNQISTVGPNQLDILKPVSRAEWPDLSRTSPDRVQDALGAAWDYYTWGPYATVAATLADRGTDVAVLEARNRRPEVGHTHRTPTGLVERLLILGFGDDELVDAGLHRRLGGGPLSDFCRQRVPISIRNVGGDFAGIRPDAAQVPGVARP
jgi:hypothetical protein